MAATKITNLAALTSVDGATDFLPIVDTSDVSMSASGTTKKLLPDNLPISTAVQTALNLKQAADADLTSIAALATTAYGRGALEVANDAAFRTYIGAGSGSGDALVANPLSQFASTTSAQLATVVSNETGTGVLVFNDTPTLISPLLGTPTSGVLTNVTGTAAGLTAGNVTTNANLTGHVTSVGNAAVLGTFTLAQLSTAISDADVASVAYADSLIIGLLDDRGNYDASVNTFPAAGGSGSAGAVLKGDLWTISVAGTLGGTAVTAGDIVRAIVDTPGQTAGNWAVSENNIGFVPLNAAIASGQFYVGNGSGIGTAVTMSGVVTMTNAGVTSLGSFTVAQLNTAISDADVATGGGTATGTNTGDQTTIVGITGTKAQFNTSVSDGDIVYLDSIDAITGVKTMSGLNVILVASSGLTIRNPANTFKYTITAAAIVADRTLTLPLTAGTLALTSDITGTNSGTNTGDQSLFSTIAVSGQSNVVADAASDTLTFVGSGIAITTDASTDTITFTVTAAAGNVVGPASATDNAVVRFDTTTGILVQNSTFLIGDSATPATIGTTPGTAASAYITTTPMTGGDTNIVTTGTGGTGAGVTLRTGTGGTATSAATAATGGAGGTFNQSTGVGGSSAVAGTGTNTGGVGGLVSFIASAGGAATGATSGTNTGGVGGNVDFRAGTGGAANTGSGSNVAGVGGAMDIRGGIGGVGTTGGTGGVAFVRGGPAGATVGAAGGLAAMLGGTASATGTGGAGGGVSITSAAAGGDGTVARSGGAISITTGTSVGAQAGTAVTLTPGAPGTNPATGTATGSNPGQVTIAAVTGGTAPNAEVASTGGIGSALTWALGIGGASSVAGTGTNTGGAGGPGTLTAGAGGAATGASSGTSTGGTGGALTYTAGTGGAANSGSGTMTGGTGGAVVIGGGTGGIGTTTSGNGGALTVRGGIAAAAAGSAGGAASLLGRDGSTTGSGGAGGAVVVTGGAAGGDNTVNRTGGAVTLTAGVSKGDTAGAAVTITGGAGGLGTSTTGSVGGAVTITPGTGGIGSATGGAGGALTLQGGLGADATADGAGSDIIFQTAATITRAETLRVSSVTQAVLATSPAAGVKALVAKGPASRTVAVMQLQNSAAASLGTVGGTIFNTSTDVPSTSINGTENDLVSYTTVANTLMLDNDSLEQVEHILTVASATATRRIRRYFAGTLIFDSGILTLALGTDFVIRTTIIRESSTVVRVSVAVITTSASTIPYATYTRITGLTLSSTNILKTTGTADGTGAASADIVEKMSKVLLQPAA